MLLELLTSTSPRWSLPAVTGATITADGLRSPLSATEVVKVTCRRIVSRKPFWPSVRGVSQLATAMAASSTIIPRRERALVMTTRRGSEQDAGAQANHDLAADPLGWFVRIGDPGARVDDVLDIRLDLPPRQSLIEIGRLQIGFRAPHRRDRAREGGGVAVEVGRLAADMRMPDADPERVVVAVIERLTQHESRIHAEIDQVAVLIGRAGDAAEHADIAVVVPVVDPHHLVGRDIGGGIPAMGARDAAARRVGERQAAIVEALVGEAFAVVPDADPVDARQR